MVSQCIDTISPVSDLMKGFNSLILDSEKCSPNSAFWISLLKMIQTLLKFEKSIKTGDCPMHLQSLVAMLLRFMPVIIRSTQGI